VQDERGGSRVESGPQDEWSRQGDRVTRHAINAEKMALELLRTMDAVMR